MPTNAVSFALKAIERKTNPPLRALNSLIFRASFVTRHSIFSRAASNIA
jgi:hypothetical protein